MQRLLLILLLVFSLASYGQQKTKKAFKLVVIQPDTAIIDRSFDKDKDSIVAIQLRRYYRAVDEIEKLLKPDSHQKDSMEQALLEETMMQLKSYESTVKRFKYLHVLSHYSVDVYNFYFNEYEPFSTIIELPNQKTDLASLHLLADTAKADYVVFYSNIHTIDNNGLPLLKVTTSLYSKKDDKIILRKETEGDTDSRGEMWTCDMDVKLSCLFINAVKTSTDAVAKVLGERQIK